MALFFHFVVFMIFCGLIRYIMWLSNIVILVPGIVLNAMLFRK